MRSLFAIVAGLYWFAASPAAYAVYLEHRCNGSTLLPGVTLPHDITQCTGRDDGAIFTFRFPNRPLSVESAVTQYALRLTAPRQHCSPVNYAVLRVSPPGRRDVLGLTSNARFGFLQPGESSDVPLGSSWGPGEHRALILATGLVEGCNTGQLITWGVDVELVPFVQAPPPR